MCLHWPNITYVDRAIFIRTVHKHVHCRNYDVCVKIVCRSGFNTSRNPIVFSGPGFELDRFSIFALLPAAWRGYRRLPTQLRRCWRRCRDSLAISATWHGRTNDPVSDIDGRGIQIGPATIEYKRPQTQTVLTTPLCNASGLYTFNGSNRRRTETGFCRNTVTDPVVRPRNVLVHVVRLSRWYCGHNVLRVPERRTESIPRVAPTRRARLLEFALLSIFETTICSNCYPVNPFHTPSTYNVFDYIYQN